jgi:hypothetical protein
MHWTKDISLLFDPLRDLARFGPDDAVRRVLTEGTPELREGDYDNWNGGATRYTLLLHVPIHVYAEVEGTIEAIEAEISKKVERLQRQETNDFISQVIVNPTAATSGRVVPARESGFWSPGHFRLFISHLSKDKRSAGNLKDSLASSGISAFVAHEDIKPTEEWQDEIEKSLSSMDALAAILSPGFRDSNWTDQEVGMALGRGVLVVPVRYGIDPYGLIGKYQGIPALGKSLATVTKSVFHALLHHRQTRARLVSCLIEQFLVCGSKDAILAKLNLLCCADEIRPEQLASIRDKIANSDYLAQDKDVLDRANKVLAKHGAEPVTIAITAPASAGDDIPF